MTRPSRARIGLALLVAVTASMLLFQVVNAAEPVPPPEKTATPPKDDPKPEPRPKRVKKVLPVKSFGGY
jgi:hypothetical protein